MLRVLLDPENEYLRAFYYVGNKYAVQEVAGKTTYMHRAIVNCPEGMQVDHRNSNTLDNRKSNLRVCTVLENAANKSIAKNNTSGYKGVSWRKSRSKWLSSIRVSGNLYHLGSFETREQAALMYDIAAKKYFGEFAKLNFNLELS